jgi:hypothetical protein
MYLLVNVVHVLEEWLHCISFFRCLGGNAVEVLQPYLVILWYSNDGKWPFVPTS